MSEYSAAIDPAFTELVARYLDDALTDTEQAELNRRLLSNTSVRTYFWIACRIAGQRHDYGRESAPPVIVTPDAQSPAPQSKIGNRKSKTSPRPIPFIIYPIAIAAAALLTAAIVVVYLIAFTTESQPEPIRPNQPGPAVATLIENTGDLTTPHGYPAEGDDFPAGEYTLSGGRAEFMLTNAVNVKLRGETRMHMRNDMNVDLTRGSAEFVCPTDARGFSVHLPDESQIVDLGTAFTVDIDDDNRSLVRVTDGRVRIAGPHGDLEASAGTTVSIDARRGYTQWVSRTATLTVTTIPVDNAENVIVRTGRFEAAVNLGLNPRSIELFGIEFARMGEGSIDRPVHVTTDTQAAGRAVNDQLRNANPWKSPISSLFDTVDASAFDGRIVAKIDGLTVGRRYRVQMFVGQPVAIGSLKRRQMFVQIADLRSEVIAGAVDADYTSPATSVVADFIATGSTIDIAFIAENEQSRAVVAAVSVFSLEPESSPEAPERSAP